MRSTRGDPGFVRVIDGKTLVLPSYDGNGMFKSMGNIRANPAVALLVLDCEQPRRLPVHGWATVHADDPLIGAFPEAQLLVRVAVRQVFPNCPRYIPRMVLAKASPHVPDPARPSPVPAWKSRPEFNEVLPALDPARTDR